ncbi:MAG: DNA polymerase domain-containing protein [Candidatus Hodarchaeales archaeon]|jgi:DNA polymerase-2
MPRIRGWLHSVTAADWGVNTYWITGKKVICAFYPFTAEFYLSKNDRRTRKQVLSHPQIESIEEVSRYLSIHHRRLRTVLCVRVNPLKIRAVYEALRKYWGEYLYNADLSIWQQFCFQTKLFPYVYATIEVQGGKLLDNWQLHESYTQMDYLAVPFRCLWLQPTFEDHRFSSGKLVALSTRHSIIDQEEKSIVFRGRTEGETIHDCIKYLHEVDPDVLFTSGGDSSLPIIAQRAVQSGKGNLQFGRGSRTLSSYVRRPSVNRGHSYMSYGRVFYSQHGVYLDGGRHHFDVSNSFMWKDGNLEGVLEITRLSCTDPQRIARGTIGTALSAVQMRTAYNRDILIPARKADAEHFRPAWAMQSDVGGLVFSPIVGFHANVTELDFLSMYPNIMVRKNVSPETINCKCCVKDEQQVVPLTEHHICTQRPGLIGLSLENILHRREYFKAKRNMHPNYDRRQKVLKWILVCCFGYQGYRNARFGRIEAHEAISAYGRHALTLTQQLAATYGLEAVAGIVDSIWLKQQDGEPIDLATTQELRQRAEKMTKLPVEHAADYHWIVFLPRRHEPEVGVLNRYYGLRTDGSFKIRGIEIRQSSSPSFIKQLQQNMLKILAKARTAEQFKTATRHAQHQMKNYQRKLKTGQIPLEELLITIRPSRSPQEYVHNSRQAIAARQLARLGVPVEPGMKLQYLLTDVQAKNPTKRVKVQQLLTGKEQYDIKEYQKLCLRSYENLIPPEFETKRLTLESFLLT